MGQAMGIVELWAVVVWHAGGGVVEVGESATLQSGLARGWWRLKQVVACVAEAEGGGDQVWVDLIDSIKRGESGYDHGLDGGSVWVRIKKKKGVTTVRRKGEEDYDNDDGVIRVLIK